MLSMATLCGQDCEPLTLTAADGTAFAFLGVPELLKRSIAPETALQPAHAAGAAGMSEFTGLLSKTSHTSACCVSQPALHCVRKPTMASRLVDCIEGLDSNLIR